jgi:hypothetical protein
MQNFSNNTHTIVAQNPKNIGIIIVAISLKFQSKSTIMKRLTQEDLSKSLVFKYT